MKKLCKELDNAIKYMAETKSGGVYYWPLGVDNRGNDWAIVLGWNDGFDLEEKDEYSDGEWRLCVKLAYQPGNSLMQCDYNWDWLMPYDEKTGDVDDTEFYLRPGVNTKEIIYYMLKWYSEYEKEWEDMAA